MEQADYEAARELFGDAGLKPLDSYLPKTLKEFEVGVGSAAGDAVARAGAANRHQPLRSLQDFAAELVSRHVTPHRESKHFKAFVKALAKAAVEPLGPDEVKDVETSLAGIRSDKAKVGCWRPPGRGAGVGRRMVRDIRHAEQ